MSAKLSDLEYELMTFFWSKKEPVTFSDVIVFCNEEKMWNWANTTIHTYLTRMIQKGVLCSNKMPGKRRTYSFAISQEEYARRSANELINLSFSGSVRNLLVSLVSDNKLTRSEADELHQLIDQIVESEYPENTKNVNNISR